MDLKKMGFEGVDWTHVAPDKDWLWALVKDSNTFFWFQKR
jgi:hypothetical protein